MSSGDIKAGRAYIEVAVEDAKVKQQLQMINSSFNDWCSSMESTGKKLFAGGVIANAPFLIAAKQFADFDDQMRAVEAVSQASKKEFKSLTDEALRLGRTMSFTAKEVASAQLLFARAGFSPDEIVRGIEPIMNLARATGTDLAISTEIAGNAIRMFNLDASDMVNVADALTAAVNSSAQDIPDLGEALKYVGPIAVEANMSLKDTLKLIGSLANFGIKGGQAGNALKRITLAMSDLNVRQKLKDQLNVDTTDAQGNLRELSLVMKDIGVAANGLPTAEKLSLFNELFGKHAVAAGAKLTASSFDQLNDAIENCAGVTERSAVKMDDGLGGSWRKMKSSIEGMSLSIGNALAPAEMTFANIVAKIADYIQEFAEESKTLVTVLSTVASTAIATGAAMYGYAKAARAAASMRIAAMAKISQFTPTGVGKEMNGTFLQGVMDNSQKRKSSIADKIEKADARIAVLSGQREKSEAMLTTAKARHAALVTREVAAEGAVATARASGDAVAVKNAEAGLRLVKGQRVAQERRIVELSATAAEGEAAAAAQQAELTRWKARRAALERSRLRTEATEAAAKQGLAGGTVVAFDPKQANIARAQEAATAAVIAKMGVANTTANRLRVSMLQGGVAAGTFRRSMAGVSLSLQSAANSFGRFVAANKMTIGIAAIGGAFALMKYHAAEAKKAVTEAMDAAGATLEAGDQKRRNASLNMEKIQAVNGKSLSESDFADFKNTVNNLQGTFGNLGISVDEQTRQINTSADSFDLLNASMKRQAEAEIDAALIAKKNYGENLQEEISDFEARGRGEDSFIDVIEDAKNAILYLGRSDRLEKNLIREQENRYAEKRKNDAELEDLRNRKKALSEGSKTAAVSGDLLQNHEGGGFNNGKSPEENLKNLADIQNRISRDRRTQLENEIADVRDLNEDYKGILQTLISIEENEEKKAEYQSQLDAADGGLQERIAKILEKVERFDAATQVMISQRLAVSDMSNALSAGRAGGMPPEQIAALESALASARVELDSMEIDHAGQKLNESAAALGIAIKEWQAAMATGDSTAAAVAAAKVWDAEQNHSRAQSQYESATGNDNDKPATQEMMDAQQRYGEMLLTGSKKQIEDAKLAMEKVQASQMKSEVVDAGKAFKDAIAGLKDAQMRGSMEGIIAAQKNVDSTGDRLNDANGAYASMMERIRGGMADARNRLQFGSAGSRGTFSAWEAMQGGGQDWQKTASDRIQRLLQNIIENTGDREFI